MPRVTDDLARANEAANERSLRPIHGVRHTGPSLNWGSYFLLWLLVNQTQPQGLCRLLGGSMSCSHCAQDHLVLCQQVLEAGEVLGGHHPPPNMKSHSTPTKEGSLRRQMLGKVLQQEREVTRSQSYSEAVTCSLD